MNSLFIALSLILAIPTISHCQQLKRSDRRMVAALERHVGYLSQPGSGADSVHSRASEYTRNQFEKFGLKARGDKGSWYQQFSINNGRDNMEGSKFSVNGKALSLNDDFFPFSFSPNKQLSASVVMALAEKGVPWFADLKDILNTSTGTAGSDTLVAILKKADRSAAKGASALIVYNKSMATDMVFHPLMQEQLSAIPVLFVSKNAFEKYFFDDSEPLDIAMHTNLKSSSTKGYNLVGFIDNGADSTSVAGALMTNPSDLAVLIEMASLAGKTKRAPYNYLFVALGSEKARQRFTAGNLRLDKIKQLIGVDTLLPGTAQDGDRRTLLNKVKTGMRLMNGELTENTVKSVN